MCALQTNAGVLLTIISLNSIFVLNTDVFNYYFFLKPKEKHPNRKSKGSEFLFLSRNILFPSYTIITEINLSNLLFTCYLDLYFFNYIELHKAFFKVIFKIWIKISVFSLFILNYSLKSALLHLDK